jgi:hypothetical protein
VRVEQRVAGDELLARRGEVPTQSDVGGKESSNKSVAASTRGMQVVRTG